MLGLSAILTMAWVAQVTPLHPWVQRALLTNCLKAPGNLAVVWQCPPARKGLAFIIAQIAIVGTVVADDQKRPDLGTLILEDAIDADDGGIGFAFVGVERFCGGLDQWFLFEEILGTRCEKDQQNQKYLKFCFHILGINRLEINDRSDHKRSGLGIDAPVDADSRHFRFEATVAGQGQQVLR